MNLEGPTLDQSNFSRLRTRLVDTDIACRFFDEVVRLARARHLLTRARRRCIHPKALGADKGYHVKEFVEHLRAHKIRPHIARIEGRKSPGLDGRTTCTEGYQISQRKRKRVEEIFGSLKTVAGMRKTRFIGQAKTQMGTFMSAAAYNLLRIAKQTTPAVVSG